VAGECLLEHLLAGADGEGRVDSPGEPVGEGTARRVGIVDDERERTPASSGGSVQESGGDRSSPSQVCRAGIGCPCSKASLRKVKACSFIARAYVQRDCR
jgi:hypothetical protein